MKRNFHLPIVLDDIVEISGLSKYHFNRLFRECLDTTPIGYLTRIRLNEAMMLLKRNRLSIETIAQNCGFANGNYFAKVFRSYLGMSPSVFRNQKTFQAVDHLISD